MQSKPGTLLQPLPLPVSFCSCDQLPEAKQLNPLVLQWLRVWIVGLDCYCRSLGNPLSFTFICISWLMAFSPANKTTIFQITISSCFPLYDLASIMTYPSLTSTLLNCLFNVHCWAGEIVLRTIHSLRESILVPSTHIRLITCTSNFSS